ncbi:MAG: hypothetical protein DKT66_06170 [Candidatus Melainabacteria bacterium]|nr:MAG: hypothetical protein DKT66_06170 [Candidatus Melainabacteria bacterium]
MQNWKLHHRDDELEYFGFSFKDLPLNVIKTCKVLRISGQGHAQYEGSIKQPRLKPKMRKMEI